MRLIRPIAAVVVLAVCSVAPGAQDSPPADLVLLNARVLTVDERFSTATAFAVRGTRFVAVGTDEEVRPFIGTATRVVDGGGRTVIPGLIDTHVHALGVAAEEARQPFRNLRSVAEVQDWIRAETRRRKPSAWIWSPRVFPTRLRERRYPTREELDAVAPGHPVAVDLAYGYVLNTAALRAAGITRESPDPPGGAVVKDAAGEPTGVLKNPGTLLDRFRPAAETVPLDGLARVHDEYLRHGITSVIERGATLAGYQSYQSLRQAGRLRVRAAVTIRIPQPTDTAATARFIDTLPDRPGRSDAWLNATALKIVADGGLLTGTSYLRQPYGPAAQELYGIDDPAYRGFLSLTPAQIAAAVDLVHRRGWPIVVHVTGDAGVDAVLDAIEAAQTATPAPDRRHTLLHAYFVHPETAARVARLGVLIDTQPAWYYKDADALAAAFGADRLAHFIGLRTWREAGATVAMNTDHMVGLDADDAMNPFNPFLTMYVATTRQTESGRVVSADEAVSRPDALKMMTREAARFSFDEQDIGSIEVGKLADFVVLDDDLLACHPERLPAIRPDLTVVGGRIAYQRAP